MRSNDQSGRKTYTPPKVKELDKDEARVLLEERARRGDRGARELLALLEEAERNQGKTERKKAG